MICRVALHEKTPGSVSSDEARGFRGWIKEQPGFVGGYHVQDSKTGRMLSITIWDSKESMQALRKHTPPAGSLGIVSSSSTWWRNTSSASRSNGGAPTPKDNYRCSHRDRHGAEACANAFRLWAEALEVLVREGISAYIRDPERLRADLEYAIELMRQEVRGDPAREAKLCTVKLADVDRRRARYQEMAAEELITLAELRARLADLGETRETAERELAALRDKAERIEELERAPRPSSKATPG